jgi:hypothetical protein
VSQPVLAARCPDAECAPLGVVGALELVGEERGPTPVGELIGEPARRGRRRAEHVLDPLEVRLVLIPPLVGFAEIELLEVEDDVP